MRALAVSVVGHGVLVAWLTQVDRAPRAPTEPEPIVEVELVDTRSDASASASASANANANANANVNVSGDVRPGITTRTRTRTHTRTKTQTTTTGSDGSGNGLLAMRTGTATRTEFRSEPRGQIDLSPQRAAAAVVANDAPVAPAVADTTADDYMRPTGGGTYEYKHPGFKGTIARDGSVTFDDTPAVVVDWGLPCVKCIGEDFKQWKKDPYGGHTVNLLGLLPVLRGSFDVTDFVERLAGNDPYAYEKNKFLEATRARRATMSATEKRDATRAALLHLPKYLAAVWAYDEWSAAKRRQVLFELWDECAESRAGAQARATILGFIRNKVAAPYTQEELAECNGKRASTEEFNPYTRAEPRE